MEKNIHYTFAASDGPSLAAASSVEALFDATSELFDVCLAGHEELELLMSLLGIRLPPPVRLLPTGFYTLLFDYSDEFLPTLTDEGFEEFYVEWLRSTKREGDMDEYGQLLFLKSYAAEWNRRDSRFILQETS